MNTTISHLVRTSSDHAPLLITMSNPQVNPVRYFKFLDFWTTQDDFMQVVQDAWNIKVDGSSMWSFHLKLKNTCKKLSYWSKHTIGNIFDKTKEFHRRIEELEDKCLDDNSDNNRMELNRVMLNSLCISRMKNLIGGKSLV